MTRQTIAQENRSGDDDSTLNELMQLVDRFNTAMLTTLSRTGRMHARPMAVAGRDDPLSTLYFVTDRDAPKVEEISADSTGLVSMQHEAMFVALSGTLVVETATFTDIEALWQPKWKVWMSSDSGNSGIGLLRFRIGEAEYWDRSGTNRLRILWRTQLARLRKEQLDDQSLPGHGKLRVGAPTAR